MKHYQNNPRQISKKELGDLLARTERAVYGCFLWYNYAMVIKNCGNCGKQITIHNNKNRPMNFCSQSCFLEYKSKSGFYENMKKTGKHPEKYSTRICARCGKSFERLSSTLTRGRGKFCSFECSQDGRHELKSCLICGKELRVKKSHAERTKYCSIKCRSAGYIKFGTLAKEKAPRYIDGKAGSKEYDCRKSHQRRVAVRGNGGEYLLQEWEDLCKKHDYTCLCCRSKNKKLTVDHIIPVSMGGSNNIDNIQPLCKSCNSKKHAKVIDYREALRE